MKKLSTSSAVVAPAVESGDNGDKVDSAGPTATSGLLPGQRWSVRRKREVVLRLLRGEAVEMLSRELGVESYRLEQWREKALSGIDAAMRERGGDPLQAELDAARRRVGELTMDNELLRAKLDKPGPLARARSRP